MATRNPAFANLVVQKNILPKDEVDKILRQSKQDAEVLLQFILDTGKLDREEAGELWAASLNIAWIDMSRTLVRPEIVALLPKLFALDNGIILIYRFGEKVTAAIADPTNTTTIEKAEMLTGLIISPVFAFREDIEDAIEIHYKSAVDLEELSSKIKLSIMSRTKEITAEELKAVAGDQAVIEFTKSVLLLAIKEGASDIHFDPNSRNIRIRYRIDGMMQDRLFLGKDVAPALISRLKIMSNLDISETRRPQDGRLSLELTRKTFDFRISVISTIWGEKVVLRILADMQSRSVPSLEELDLSSVNYELVKKLIKTPNGVFFITGPTGSGKTTTLFSALKYINNSEINIMTLEDPVEYRLPGINQAQTHHKIGVTFANMLRSLLRQDPDVILIGEIRDLETAKIATEAALTGHLVLSTLHTNDAIQAVTRLVEIGVEPFIVGPSIIGVMAQRLVRRICLTCREAYEPDKELFDSLFISREEKKVNFYRGKGCPNCDNTGYKGRIAVHEMIFIDNIMREMVTKNAPNTELRNYARSKGFLNLRYDGIKKVLRGLTTYEELDRVTFCSDE